MAVTNPKFPSSFDQTAQDTLAAVDTEVAAILAAVDTEVAAIKTKTDNLPASPAAQAKLDTLHDTRIPGVIQAQTGDSFARLGAPAGASISADVAAAQAKLDTLHDTRIPGVIEAQTGDSFARLGAPAGASVSADIAAAKADTAAIKLVTDIGEKVVVTGAAVMVDNDTLFTVAGGPILVEALWSECVTTNDATASTLVYKSTPTTGSEQTLSNPSASLANAAAGASVSLIGTALTTAANLNANGANLGMTAPLVVPAGTLQIDVAVGSTTGTWRHYLRYKPLSTGVTVT